MRNRTALLLLVPALLLGCGGEGSSSTGGIAEETQNFSLGAVRGDAPTTVKLSITKPFYPAAEVELAEAPTGPFEPKADLLPLSADNGPEVPFWVTFTPPSAPAPALQQGTIRLLFRSPGGARAHLTLQLHAEVETPSARLLQTEVSAGRAAVGETVRFGVYVVNTSVATPIVVTGVTPPEGEFSIAPDAAHAPFPVGPGSRAFVWLTYTPEGEWQSTSLLQVHHSAAPEPLEATVVGTGIAPRLVSEYPYVPLDPVTFESDWVTLDVPAEAVGIFLEVWGDPSSSLIDLIGLEGPSGVVYETPAMTGPLGWLSNYPAGGRGYLNVELPDSAEPAVQLVRGGGTYRFRLRDSAFATHGLFVRATVSQRAAGAVREGTLDLHVFLADGLLIADRSDPMSDVRLDAAMKTIDAVLGRNSIRLGTVSYSFLDPVYDTLADPAEAENLIAANTASLAEGALNLFFVKDMSYGVTSVAGATPGPVANGTPYSGVVIDFDAADATTVGITAAHEIGNYLGHFDPAAGGVLLLPEEAYSVLRHPLLNPGLPEDLVSPPESTNEAWILALVEMMPPVSTWCGTCVRPPAR